MTLKSTITEDMKNAMRAKETLRLGTIRMLLAAIKQIEIDKKIEVDDDLIMGIINKMIKQRRDSKAQFAKANRPELAQKEEDEIGILMGYLPSQLTNEGIEQLISQVLSETGATSLKDMGKVMASVKPKVIGRADMSVVSQKIKQRLQG